LLDTLDIMNAENLRRDAAAAIAATTAPFDPVKAVVPALVLLRQRHGERVNADSAFLQIWRSAAEFFLSRSEQPPKPPADWKQEVTLPCRCEDCRGLETFARNAAEQTCRFRVNQQRRSHLEHAIRQNRMDISYTTDRRGSPQTLVCTKTRGAYRRRMKQYRADIAAMSALQPLARADGGMEAALSSRLLASMRKAPKALAAGHQD
jgi:hypothetical protein